MARSPADVVAEVEHTPRPPLPKASLTLPPSPAPTDSTPSHHPPLHAAQPRGRPPATWTATTKMRTSTPPPPPLLAPTLAARRSASSGSSLSRGGETSFVRATRVSERRCQPRTRRQARSPCSIAVRSTLPAAPPSPTHLSLHLATTHIRYLDTVRDQLETRLKAAEAEVHRLRS